MIIGYSTKPAPRFSYATGEDKNTTRTYGLELEVDCGENVPLKCDYYELDEAVCNISDLLYSKRDASLSNDGLEIISNPCSLRYHMNNMRWKFIAQTCVKNGYRSHESRNETCGLHIHVGRKQLGDSAEERDDTVRKIIVLVERYWQNIVAFTRRESYRLDEWAPRPRCHWWYAPNMTADILEERAEDEIETFINYDHNARYTAVNVTNRDTIEFRIFRGTLKRDTIIASVQFVDNLCEYAMTHTWRDIQESTWEDVVLCKHYNELDNYLVHRGLVSAAAIPAEPIRSHRTPDFVGADGVAAVDPT